MAQIVIFHDETEIKALLVTICQDDGYEIITAVSEAESALNVLRTTPHSVVAIVNYDRAPLRSGQSFFATISSDPEHYSRHRFIALDMWQRAYADTGLLSELQVIVLHRLLDVDDLLAAVEKSSTLLRR
jgi:hypothetical protein